VAGISYIRHGILGTGVECAPNNDFLLSDSRLRVTMNNIINTAFPHAALPSLLTLQAVFFDMDGTLVDTEDAWWEAEQEVLAELGHPIGPEHHRAVLGGPLEASCSYLIKASGAPVSVPELAAMFNAKVLGKLAQGVRVQPGARELFAVLAAAQIPYALVSACERVVIDAVLVTLGAEHFAFSVAGDEIDRTKPYPDPYLTAAARLGADPRFCVVVEDSPTGMAAAEAADCAVVMVPSLAARPQPASRRAVVSSLKEIDLPLLRQLAQTRSYRPT
jgi:HAD superfamily hydrolase (TIGR01509 family)